jgi:hypothetical protein
MVLQQGMYNNVTPTQEHVDHIHRVAEEAKKLLYSSSSSQWLTLGAV